MICAIIISDMALAQPLKWYHVDSRGWPEVNISQPKDQVVALINEVAARHGLDPLFVQSIVAVESAFQEHALSPKGAIGLMQVMPETAKRFGISDLFQDQNNLEAGATYLSWLMQHFDSRLDLVLAGYNAGEGAVSAYGNTVPPYPETQLYVDKVLATYMELRGQSERTQRPVAREESKPDVRQEGDSYLHEVVELLIK
jgi:soluble lytic murein transglycosylase-like protein